MYCKKLNYLFLEAWRHACMINGGTYIICISPFYSKNTCEPCYQDVIEVEKVRRFHEIALEIKLRLPFDYFNLTVTPENYCLSVEHGGRCFCGSSINFYGFIRDLEYSFQHCRV